MSVAVKYTARFAVAIALYSTAIQAQVPKADVPQQNAGVTYYHNDVKEVPWSIHIVRMDRHRPDLRFVTTLGQGTRFGMSVVSAQIKALPPDLGRPLAAINGDFFHSTKAIPGDPEGVQISGGELFSAPFPSRSCFWIDSSGRIHMTNATPDFSMTWPDGRQTPLALNQERESSGAVLYTHAVGAQTPYAGGTELLLERAGSNDVWVPLQVGRSYKGRVRQVNTMGNTPLTKDTIVISIGSSLASKLRPAQPGEVIQISTATIPDMGGAEAAIGGGPALVRGGKAMTFKGIQARHPRSAIGWNADTFFMVGVDGRQRSSLGMSLPELATYMENLGCTEALNLDGGGSATLWAYGAVVNSPSQGQERPAANALVVVQDSRTKVAARKAP